MYLLFLVLVVIINITWLNCTFNQCSYRDNWPVTRRRLYVPNLDTISHVLEERLRQHFEHVDAQVINCPDLRQPPYSMANSGMSGNSRLLDLGHLSYSVPVPNRSKSYALTDLVNLAQLDNAFAFGGGGGPFRQLGYNSEGIFNFNYRNCTLHQHSVIAKVDNRTERGFVVKQLDNNYPDVSFAGTFFASRGIPGNVVRINATRRINATFEITRGIREILLDYYGPERGRAVGLGVIAVVRRGTCRIQVMPDFATSPILDGSAGFFRWVHYFNMSAPLTLLGTIVTQDLGLSLYSPHFHLKSDHEEAGHWHYDLTPEIVEYEVLISPGEFIYKIDQPGAH